MIGPLLSDRALRPSGPRPYSRRAFDVRADLWAQRYAIGLSRSLHAEHVAVADLRDDVGGLGARVTEVERLASIAEVTAWLRHVDVPETLLVSVVMPTRNRDDASSDETWALLQKYAANDPRIRAFRFDDQRNSSVARNHALDLVQGDLVVYLDDDNRFDPDWVRSVAWAFSEYPETQVAYGARVVDDDTRHQGRPGRSMPIVQFLAWDRVAMMESNRVDQNVIAHRPSPVRFDEAIDQFSDWDLMLQLTEHWDPLELPAVAVHYYSDGDDRVTSISRRTGVEDGLAARVRERARTAGCY